MPTYFFHIRGRGEFITDPVGLELPHLDCVQKECVGMIRQVLAEPEWRDQLASDRDFVITDELGCTVLVVPLEALPRENASPRVEEDKIFEQAGTRLQ